MSGTGLGHFCKVLVMLVLKADSHGQHLTHADAAEVFGVEK